MEDDQLGKDREHPDAQPNRVGIVLEFSIPLLASFSEVVSTGNALARNIIVIDSSLPLVDELFGIDKEHKPFQDGIHICFGSIFIAKAKADHFPERRELEDGNEAVAFVNSGTQVFAAKARGWF